MQNNKTISLLFIDCLQIKWIKILIIIEKISEYYKIDAIILFGSYAKGTENADSDIDIAIISSDFSDIIDDGAKLIELTWKIATRIEPHPISTEDFEKVSNLFAKEVIDTGIKVA